MDAMVRQWYVEIKLGISLASRKKINISTPPGPRLAPKLDRLGRMARTSGAMGCSRHKGPAPVSSNGVETVKRASV